MYIHSNTCNSCGSTNRTSAPVATVTDATCTVGTGTITVTSPAPATGISYSIDGINYSNTTGIFTGLIPGNYSVTVQGAPGCISTATAVTINPPPAAPAAPTATATDATCTVSTGAITVTSPAPGAGIGYSIDGTDYSNTTGVFTGLIPGTYTVTVNNGSCISLGASVTINAPPSAPAAPTVVVTDATCAVTTGTITVTAPVPGTGIGYSIDGTDYSNTTGIFSGLTPGNYNVTVNNGSCISLGTAVTVNAAPAAPVAPVVSVTNPTCTVPTGTITVTSPVPAAGISYSIDGINYTNTTGIFTGLTPGNYNVTVQGAPGCISTATPATVAAVPSSPAAPVATITDATCTVGTGTITVTSPAPVAGISYSIDGIDYSNTTGIFTGLIPGNYSITVQGAPGCISTATAVTINPPPAAPAAPTATATDATCTVSTGAITVTSPAPGAGIGYSIDGTDYTNTTGVFTGLNTRNLYCNS